MASKKNKARSARDANPRKFKKKTSILVIEKTEYIDYKDVDLLRRFMSDRSKIKNRRVAGNTLQQQREVANAVKVAREMALLPYATRVASTRTGGRRDRDGGRDGGGRGRDDRDESSNDGDDAKTDAKVDENAVDENAVDENAVDQTDATESTESTDAEVEA